MTFADPLFLLLLIALPLLAVWEWRRVRYRESALTFSDTAAAVSTPRTFWSRARHLPAAFRLGAIALVIVALARPQERNVLIERTSEGIDIMLVLDLSSSMLAQDFRPNRLEVARDVALQFVSQRTSDRIGLVVFSGRAFTQAPLTLDYTFLQSSIRAAQIGLLEDGTAIGTALATAVARLRESDAASRVVVLLTDGRNNRGEIDPLTAAEIAQLYGVRVYAVGMGTTDADAFGRPIPQHLRSLLPEDGGVDEATLSALAEMTGGAYFHAEDRAGLEAVYAEISALEQSEIREETFVDVAERYPLFLWPAIALIGLAVTLSSTRLRQLP